MDGKEILTAFSEQKLISRSIKSVYLPRMCKNITIKVVYIKTGVECLVTLSIKLLISLKCSFNKSWNMYNTTTNREKVQLCFENSKKYLKALQTVPKKETNICLFEFQRTIWTASICDTHQIMLFLTNMTTTKSTFIPCIKAASFFYLYLLSIISPCPPVQIIFE